MEQSPDTASFIARWQNSGAAERANYQLFLSEPCDLLGVARPDPTKPEDADVIERGCYVLEAKQGVEKRWPDSAAKSRR